MKRFIQLKKMESSEREPIKVSKILTHIILNDSLLVNDKIYDVEDLLLGR